MAQEIMDPQARELTADGATLVAESGMIALLNKSEIDQQITTAHKYPRSLTSFRRQAQEMATLNETIAKECIYALPRDGKVIEGPSARLAEILASCWGNCRAGARVVDIGPEFVTAQGVFHDLERNNSVTFEVQRRITNSKGRRYNADMIAVTANAACSIALRNAVFKGVPKAYWADIYAASRKVVAGDARTLVDRRANMLKEFQIFGVTAQQMFDLLQIKGIEDVTIEHMVMLAGLQTALKEGDTTVEQAFPPKADGTAVAPKGNGKSLEGFAGAAVDDKPAGNATAGQTETDQKAEAAPATTKAAEQQQQTAAQQEKADTRDPTASWLDSQITAARAATKLSDFEKIDDDVCAVLDREKREDLRGTWNAFYPTRKAELEAAKKR